MGKPFQLLSLRLVGMWSFSRLEIQQEAMTAWRRCRVFWFCITAPFQSASSYGVVFGGKETYLTRYFQKSRA
jgi:pyruvate-formate lyase